MKTILRIGIFLLATTLAWGQTNTLTSLLQQGLFEEQANRNLEAAITDYQTLAAQFAQDRQLAATAVFRLGECYRAEGRTNEAAAQYQRIIHEFSDQQTLATLSRQNLAGLGIGSSGGPVPAAEPPAAESADTQLWNRLKGLTTPQLARMLPTLVPDATLDALLQQHNEVQAKLAQLQMDYSPTNIICQRQEALLKEINEQTDDRITGMMQALKLRAEIPQRGNFQTRLQSIGNRAGNPSSAPEMTTDEEAHEIQRIEQLIQNSPDLINGGSSTYTTPLVGAAFQGWLKVAAYLLDHGADVNAACFSAPVAMAASPDLYDGKVARVTPLLVAAATGNKAMTALLIDRGADVNLKGPHGNTPLHLASRNGYQAVAEVLLASHADVNALNVLGVTPLFSAAENGQVKVVQMLLAAGAAVDSRDGGGRTVLNYVIGPFSEDGYTMTPESTESRTVSPETIQALLAARANPNTEDKVGRTPLSYATERDTPEVVKLLLAAKADPNAGSLDAPLLCAIHKNDAAAAELLLQAGANANLNGHADEHVTSIDGTSYTSGKSSITPLYLAVLMNRPEMVRLLLKFKANPDDSQFDGRPVIFNAIHITNILTALLEGGANLESHDPTCSINGIRPNWTPLAAAVWQPSLGAVKLLLQHGANPNALDTTGGEPLHWDVNPWLGQLSEQNSKIAELLLDHGADPNIRNSEGHLPLEWVTARLNQNEGADDKLNATKIAQLLRQHGALDKLPEWDAITMSRPAANFSYAIFHRGTNDWNQFTLLEAILNFYTSAGNYSVSQGNGMWAGYPLNSMLPFPDLTHVVIVRPERNSTNGTRRIVNLLNGTNGIECSRDVPLEFGDVVEIPERDHSLGDNSAGLVGDQHDTLIRYLSGHVRLEVQDQHVDLAVCRLPGLVSLATALGKPEARRILLASSDLSRVKVTRRDPKTGESRELIVDCSPPRSNPNGGAPYMGSSPVSYQWNIGGNNSSAENEAELWLRDGDVITVPEKR